MPTSGLPSIYEYLTATSGILGVCIMGTSGAVAGPNHKSVVYWQSDGARRTTRSRAKLDFLTLFELFKELVKYEYEFFGYDIEVLTLAPGSGQDTRLTSRTSMTRMMSLW
jgi:hypothetical protein